MFLQRQLNRLRRIYGEYPGKFWALVGISFIDAVGGALLFPFLSLYITARFGVGMTEVGVLFGLFSISSIAGSMVGGALADKYGRKGMVIIGLIFSALTSLMMGLAPNYAVLIPLVLVVGLFSNLGQPARQAMVADMLPESQRAEGFGVLRVSFNLAVTIGPAIGGLLASRSYLLLFISDAVSSLIVAMLVLRFLPETRPRWGGERSGESLVGSLAGYRHVLRDVAFLLFMLANMMMALVYMQMNTTLGVYLRDVHGVALQSYGYLLSLNAGMVVLLQFSITRRIRAYAPMLMMALGSSLYALGFGMYGFVASYPLFALAMVIITLGEMIVAPVGQALVAQMSPEEMRGRYMAFFGFSWIIPSAVGPLLAGIALDNFNPNLVWYVAGVIGMLAAGMFLTMSRQAEARRPAAVMPGS
jgi:MFS family permease